MESFRTELHCHPFQNRISLSDRVLTLGSCFSDAIGSKLTAYKIRSLVNPFGVLYNPHSIHKVVEYSASNHDPSSHTFVQRDDLFLNYDFHSKFASSDLDNLKAQLKTTITSSHLFLKEASWLIITYGTAWVYQRADNDEVVANCHKLPATLFRKSLSTQKKILTSFSSMYETLKSLNPEIKIILTVSPVRHVKDTLPLNSVSKSTLRVVCHTLTEQYKDVYYFPSYEIMVDDLRDYRFYKADMIHPNDVAEEYIWQRFARCCFDDNLQSFLIKWNDIMAALTHRPFHVASPSHQNFLKETIKKLHELKALVNVDKEIAKLTQQLTQAD